MILPEKERERFFDNYIPLLFYAAVYESLMPQSSTLADFKKVSLQTKANSRDALYKDKDILRHFLADNKHLLDNHAIDFIGQVSIGLLAKFIVLKQRKKSAVLLEIPGNKFYEVINITDSFDEMLAHIPVQTETAIFNFNGKILCDGLIVGGNIHIGPRMTKGFLRDYKEAKEKGQVISLMK